MRRLGLLFPLVIILAGCGTPDEKMTVAITSNVQDSGLMDSLGPMFHDQTGIIVQVVAVSPAEALELAQRGGADVVILNDPEGEDQLMASGHGIMRRELMSNDFVLVGPRGDPAGVRQEDTLERVFQRLAERQVLFVSRVDEAGTHQRERQLWKRALIEPLGDWYIRSDASFGSALRLASQLQAYTLVDRATFLMQKTGLDLEIVFQGDGGLVNHYSAIAIRSDRSGSSHVESARKFVEFLVSPRVQTVIGKHGIEDHGQPLYTPHLTSSAQIR